MDKELKIFALEYIKLHDDLLKEEKLALGDFVMEASDEQVKFMLMTGEVKDKLTEEDLSFIKEGGDVVLYNPTWGQLGRMFTKGQNYETGIQAGIKGTLLAAAVAAIALKAYKEYLSKAARACKGKKGVDKKNCMSKFKKEAQKTKIANLQKGLTMCPKTKNPQTCKNKLQTKISKEKAKMGAL